MRRWCKKKKPKIGEGIKIKSVPYAVPVEELEQSYAAVEEGCALYNSEV